METGLGLQCGPARAQEPASPAVPARPADRASSAVPEGQRSSGNRRSACAASRRETPPMHANTRASGGECSRKQNHRNPPESVVMSHRFDSYLEVAKRALSKGRIRDVSLC